MTEPDGVSVLPVPAFLLSKLCVKLAVSPLAKVPLVIVGTPAEVVVPSYALLSVTAVTESARAVIEPVLTEARVTL